MAFQFAFTLPGPIPVSWFNGKSDAVLTVDIGDDGDKRSTYSLWVSLSPMPGGIPGEMQFAFWIAAYDWDTAKFYKYWDARDTKGFLIQEHREVVLFLVCQGLGQLCRTRKPRSIFIQTYDADLPPKALIKYERILEAASAAGYVVAQLEPYHGHLAWLGTHKDEVT